MFQTTNQTILLQILLFADLTTIYHNQFAGLINSIFAHGQHYNSEAKVLHAACIVEQKLTEDRPGDSFWKLTVLDS